MRHLLGNVGDFPENKLKTVTVSGEQIVVANTGSGFCAVANRCPHLGLSISGGKLLGNVITCPWHNSDFNVCTGENLDWVRGVAGVKMPEWVRGAIRMGRQPAPIKTYPVIEEDGQLYVEL